MTLLHCANVLILNQKHTVTDKIPPNTMTIKYTVKYTVPDKIPPNTMTIRYTVKHTVTDKIPPKHDGH